MLPQEPKIPLNGIRKKFRQASVYRIFAILSGGIWEAMITTATGLITAIFSFAVYEIFDWLSMRRVRDMEQTVSVLTESCRGCRVQPAEKGCGNETL